MISMIKKMENPGANSSGCSARMKPVHSTKLLRRKYEEMD
jgi:hypothetical protein